MAGQDGTRHPTAHLHASFCQAVVAVSSAGDSLWYLGSRSAARSQPTGGRQCGAAGVQPGLPPLTGAAWTSTPPLLPVMPLAGKHWRLAMRFVMLSESINSSPVLSSPGLAALCSHPSTGGLGPLQPAPTCTRWKGKGSSPPPAAWVQTCRSGPDHTALGEEAAPVLHPLSPGPGETPAEQNHGPQRRMLRAGGRFLCVRTETVRDSFPRDTGARGQGGGIRGSSVQFVTAQKAG